MSEIRLIIVMASAGFLAQAQGNLAFEVASVKPSQGMGIRAFESGRLSIGGMTLMQLIVYAYSIDSPNPSISGGPKWMADPSQRFAIELQTLLAERFRLNLRRETKEVDGYALVLDRKDGRLGPNLVEVTGKSCAVPTAPQESMPRCGMLLRPFSEEEGIQLFASRMKHFTDILSMPIFDVRRPVVDRTGLVGEFDIKLQFALLAGTQDRGITPTDRVNGPSLASALRQQLGLTFDPVRISTEILVVEYAEMPSEN